MLNSLVTRGLSTQKRNRLVVWGLVGQKVIVFNGAGPGSPQYYNDYLEQELAVWFTYKIELIGSKEYRVEGDLELVGSKEFDLQEDLMLTGTKELQEIYVAYIKGAKQFGFDESILMEGAREFNINEIFNLYGSRELILKDNINLKGKKDIINILEATDLI